MGMPPGEFTFTGGIDSLLVYRYSRNPMYLGMGLALLGLALWWASVPGLALVLAFCLYINRYQIHPEERALAVMFGEEFTSYMSRVRRWI